MVFLTIRYKISSEKLDTFLNTVSSVKRTGFVSHLQGRLDCTPEHSNWQVKHRSFDLEEGWVGGISPHSSRLGTLWLPNEAGRACNLGNGCWAGRCGPSLSRGLTRMKTTTKVMSAGILPSTNLQGNSADAIYLWADAPLLYPNPISIPFFPFRKLRHNRSPGQAGFST